MLCLGSRFLLVLFGKALSSLFPGRGLQWHQPLSKETRSAKAKTVSRNYVLFYMRLGCFMCAKPQFNMTTFDMIIERGISKQKHPEYKSLLKS
jgi:hypothetical protein